VDAPYTVYTLCCAVCWCPYRRSASPCDKDRRAADRDRSFGRLHATCVCPYAQASTVRTANKLGIDSKKYKVIELRLFALPFTFSYKGTTTSALATRRFTRLQLTSLYTLDRTRACLSPSHVRGTVARTCSSTLSRLSTLHRARCGNRNNTRHATTLRTKCTEHMIDEIS
jgi:hypothetical protein